MNKLYYYFYYYFGLWVTLYRKQYNRVMTWNRAWYKIINRLKCARHLVISLLIASVYEIGSFVRCGIFCVIPMESFDRREPLGWWKNINNWNIATSAHGRRSGFDGCRCACVYNDIKHKIFLSDRWRFGFLLRLERKMRRAASLCFICIYNHAGQHIRFCN